MWVQPRWISTVSHAITGCALLLASAALPSSPLNARERVELDGGHPLGTIIINTSERRLYFVLGHRLALRHSVAVGKEGMKWSGETFVQSKRRNPGWTPASHMRRENPSLPAFVPPGPENPLGVRAIYLGWSEYRIHGTNMLRSIGRAASIFSSGCLSAHPFMS